MTKAHDTRDPLTGLAKRAEFDTILAAAVEDAGSARPVSVALVDIDRFAALNERLGHQKGDEVILAVAQLLGGRLGAGGARVCRMGGDEFAVILTGVEKEAAFLELERARKALGELEQLRDMEPRPTMSIGVATCPDDGGTRQEIVRKADDALFRAKSAGRDRVALAREEKKVPKTSHFTQGQLDRLAALSAREGVGEAELLREALDDLLKKYSS